MGEKTTFSYSERGRLEKAVVGDVTILARARRDGASLRFTKGAVPFLEVRVTSVDDDGGSIARTTVEAEGDGVDYRLALDFAEEPGRALREGKLEADVTVQIDGDTVHHGVFDGAAWRATGLDGVPTLQDVLADRQAGALGPLLPALRSIVQAHDEAGLGVATTPPETEDLETFWGGSRVCKWYCTASYTAAMAACCTASAPAGPGGCVVCTIALGIAMDECKERC
jgi:hypothetical protein